MIGFVFSGLLAARLAAGCACAQDQPKEKKAAPQGSWHTFAARCTGGTILVDAKIAGKDVFVAIDTGASYSVIDRDWAAQAGLHLADEEKEQDQLVAAKAALGVRIDMSEDHFEPRKMYCAPISSCAQESMGLQMVGILGYDYLKDRVIRFDYAAGTAEWQAGPGFKYAGSGVQIPILAENARIAATLINIAGQEGDSIGTLALLDTGFNNDFSVSKELARRAHLGLDAAELERSGCDARGKVTGTFQVGYVRGIELGPLKFTPRDLIIEDMPFNIPILIGTGALAKYTVIADYTRARIILEDNPAGAAKAAAGLGLMMKWSDSKNGLKVEWARKGLAADRSGVRAGDIITKVQGRSTAEIRVFEWTQASESAAREGRALVLTVVRDGAERDVTIAANGAGRSP